MRVGAMDHTKNQITEGPVWKPLLSFFFPIVLGTFFQQFYNTADTVIVGQFLGTAALAAVGSGAVIVSLLVGFFTGLASGAAVIIAQHFGAGDHRSVSAAVHTAAVLSVVSGLVITVAGFLLTPLSLRLMNVPEDIMADATVYMQIYYLGMIPLMLYNMGTGILRSIGDSRRPVYFLILSAIANIVLDLLFVAVIPMGVAGAALATVLSEVLAMVLVLLCLFRADGAPWQIHMKSLRTDRGQLREICRVGLPTGLQTTLYTVSNMVVQASINGFGTDTVAAWTVYGKVDFLYWMTVSAMGLSITTFAGQNFGAKQYDRMKKGTNVALGITAIFTLAICAGLLVLARPILMLFTSDANVVRITLEMMHFLVPFYISYIFVEILAGTIRAAGDAVIPTVFTCFGTCLLRVLWIWLAVPLSPTIITVEWCYPITWCFTSLLYIVYYLHGGWLRRRIRVQELLETPDL